MKQLLNKLLLGSIAFMVILSGCKKDDLQLTAPPPTPSNQIKNHSHEVATSWFDVELELIKNISLNPPKASRALGYTGIALYESLVPGMNNFSNLQSKLGYAYTLPQPASNNYYWPAVANASLKTIITKLFPTANQTIIISHFNQLRNQYLQGANSYDISASEAYGVSVANVIFEWSETDGANKTYPIYQAPTFPGAWEGTNPLLPYWGDNRPFLASSISRNCLPSDPIHKFSSLKTSAFYREAFDVYKTVENINPEQEEIAKYWADGGGTVTPPGHMISIATQMIRKNNVDLNTSAIIYAKMGMAVTDAFIACWKGKYIYSLMRPVTYINKYIDPNWKSLIGTPPFPSYASGHSTVSGACAEILTHFFGNVPFTDETHYPKVRSFKNFRHAADEAAVSRLYGGIHYRMDNEIGLKKGKLIGDQVVKLNLTK